MKIREKITESKLRRIFRTEIEGIECHQLSVLAPTGTDSKAQGNALGESTPNGVKPQRGVTRMTSVKVAPLQG